MKDLKLSLYQSLLPKGNNSLGCKVHTNIYVDGEPESQFLCYDSGLPQSYTQDFSFQWLVKDELN